MADPKFTRADYKSALLALLPTGRVWPKEPGSLQAAVMEGLAPTFERLDARAQTLLWDAFPINTVELLPEWENTLGLPDPCEGEAPVIEQRRTQVINKLVNAGGQSVPYFLGVLSRLGYTNATIDQFSAFRTDASCADTSLYDESWVHAWRINLPDFRAFYFTTDVSAADEPLVTIADSTAIFCVIETLKPAHTTVLYSFG